MEVASEPNEVKCPARHRKGPGVPRVKKPCVGDFDLTRKNVRIASI